MKLKMLEKAVLTAFLLAALCSMLGFAQNCEDISTRVVRLHVLANSDTEEDQALKLQVRDRILEEGADTFALNGDKEQALASLSENLGALERAARDEIARRGYSYPVRVELTNMYFTTREYDTVTLPAGQYDALRVTIGEGEGHNWWCVMFPPMCLASAQGEESAALENILPPEEADIVENSEQYELRFKVVEWYEGAKDWLKGLFG